MTGRTNASVLPLPVGADTQMSLGLKPPLPSRDPCCAASRIAGITSACTDSEPEVIGWPDRNLTGLGQSLPAPGKKWWTPLSCSFFWSWGQSGDSTQTGSKLFLMSRQIASGWASHCGSTRWTCEQEEELELKGAQLSPKNSPED